MKALHRLPHPTVNRWRARRARLVWWWHKRRPDLLKRGLDLLLVLPALLLLAPLFALVALAIRLHDGGPVLVWQQRVGRFGQMFALPKFRTLRVEAQTVPGARSAFQGHEPPGVSFKTKNDPRISPVGRLIRRSSIDDLPQLWCVLRGSMSLVGPRPQLPFQVARYTLADRERLNVRPGLTCIWQVNGRSEVPFPQQVEMDLDYIRRSGLRTDLGLLLRTLPAVVHGRGAC